MGKEKGYRTPRRADVFGRIRYRKPGRLRLALGLAQAPRSPFRRRRLCDRGLFPHGQPTRSRGDMEEPRNWQLLGDLQEADRGCSELQAVLDAELLIVNPFGFDESPPIESETVEEIVVRKITVAIFSPFLAPGVSDYESAF